MGMLHNLADLIKIKKDKMTILVLGLNNSGKSSIINHFKKSSEQTSIVVRVKRLRLVEDLIRAPWEL